MKIVTVRLQSVNTPTNDQLYSTEIYATQPSDVDGGRAASPRIKSLSVSRRLHWWVWGGDDDGGSGELVMSNTDSAFNYLLSSQDRFYYWIKIGEHDEPLANHMDLAFGRSELAELIDSNVRIPLGKALWRWEGRVNSDFAAGSGVLENKPMPWGFGVTNGLLCFDRTGTRDDYHVAAPLFLPANVYTLDLTLQPYVGTATGFTTTAQVSGKPVAQGAITYDPLDQSALVTASRVWKYVHSILPGLHVAPDTTYLDSIDNISGTVQWQFGVEVVTGKRVMDLLAYSIGCCLKPLRNGAMSVAHFRLATPGGLEIGPDQMFGGLNLVYDRAAGLVNSFSAEVFHAVNKQNIYEGDYDVAVARRSVTKKSTAVPNVYIAEEVAKREPIEVATVPASFAQAEIDRIVSIYSSPRFRPECEFVAPLEYLGPAWELGMEVTLRDDEFFPAGMPSVLTGWRFDARVEPGQLTTNMFLTFFG